MNRWTAKFLLLVLLAGLFAPMAAAVSTPAPHCVRKPIAAQPDSMPGCHHHSSATTSAHNEVRLEFLSRQCCEGHECCRSTVRSSWAHVNLGTFFGQTDLIDQRVSIPHTPLPNLELAAYQSVRGPPAL